MFVFSFVCLRLRLFFLCFLIFLLIVGYPLPTPWARLASCWIDVGAIIGLTFPRVPPPALSSKKLRKKLAKNLQRTIKKLTKSKLAKTNQSSFKTFRKIIIRILRGTCKELTQNLQKASKELARKLCKNKITKSEISSSGFPSSTQQQPQQTSSYKRGAAVLALAHSDFILYV